MYPIHLNNYLLTSTVPSPIVVIRKYCTFLNPISLHRDLTLSQQSIWGTLEPSLIHIIAESWEYLLRWVFSENHIFGENETENFKIAMTAISYSKASKPDIISEGHKSRVEFISQYCFINIG